MNKQLSLSSKQTVIWFFRIQVSGECYAKSSQHKYIYNQSRVSKNQVFTKNSRWKGGKPIGNMYFSKISSDCNLMQIIRIINR